VKRDSRLSVALHLLLHMDELGGALTSDALGPMTKSNPVVVRRTLAGLRDAGIVRSVKGHGGGWSLARELGAITIADVYDALETSALFGIGTREEKPRCLLEQAVNRAIGEALDEAEELVKKRLRSISLADLAKAVPERARRGGQNHA
jgi:Rrf2 family protein